jgi:hypothetical protein
MDVYLDIKREGGFVEKNMTISINGKVYRIVNINEGGVGFLFDSDQDINPLTVLSSRGRQNKPAVHASSIPRFLIARRSPTRPLLFKSGWIYGPEPSTRHDLGGKKLLQDFIAEHIYCETEETEK